MRCKKFGTRDADVFCSYVSGGVAARLDRIRPYWTIAAQPSRRRQLPGVCAEMSL